MCPRSPTDCTPSAVRSLSMCPLSEGSDLNTSPPPCPSAYCAPPPLSRQIFRPRSPRGARRDEPPFPAKRTTNGARDAALQPIKRCGCSTGCRLAEGCLPGVVTRADCATPVEKHGAVKCPYDTGTERTQLQRALSVGGRFDDIIREGVAWQAGRDSLAANPHSHPPDRSSSSRCGAAGRHSDITRAPSSPTELSA